MPRRDTVPQDEKRALAKGVPQLNEHLDGRLRQRFDVSDMPGWTVTIAVQAHSGDLVEVHIESPVQDDSLNLTTRQLRRLPLGEMHRHCLAASAEMFKGAHINRKLSPGMVTALVETGHRLHARAVPAAPQGGRKPLTDLDKAAFARDYVAQVVPGYVNIKTFAMERGLRPNTVHSRIFALRRDGYLTSDPSKTGRPYGRLTAHALAVLQAHEED